MRLRLVDPYTVPVRDMIAADRLNDALIARERAHAHRRLSRQMDGFEARMHARQAAKAYSLAFDMLAAARASRRTWQ